MTLPYPSVSTIIAVRNGERWLAGAIDSVLRQTWRPAEILLVDGHSTDSTAAIAARYPEICYVPQSGRGVGDAYNCGIAAATSPYIAFLSHDDIWLPQKLELQMQHLLAHPEAQYVVGRVKFFLEPGFATPAGFRPELFETAPVAFIMETLLARRPVFDCVGVFDPQLTSGEDVDWFARAKDANVAHGVCDEILVHKRVHSTNTSLTDPTTNQILLQVLRRSLARKGPLAPRRAD
jgi:glycosyltransferase involved in cell wall biosynthesis